MLSVIDTPEIGEHEEHDLYEEQPQARAAHRGFWQTVKQHVTRHRVQTPTGTPSLSHISRHPFETPVEFWARQYPSLYLEAFAGQ